MARLVSLARRWRDRRASARAVDRFLGSATEPTVLFVVDAQGWAHDFKAQALKRHLADEFDCHIVYERLVQPADIERFDVVLLFDWQQLRRSTLAPCLPALRSHTKVAVGYTSHRYEDDPAGTARLVEVFASASFVNSRLLFAGVSPTLSLPLHETPNGVDTERFVPGPRRSPSSTLRVGWAGSITNHGDTRGYRSVIEPAVSAVDGVELVTAAREDRWRSVDEMVDWYHGIDVYVCASSTEGTPNPCLEAAASAKPLITTPVGNMPEFVQSGVNGLFIERSVDSLVEALVGLRDDPDLVAEMGRAARRSAEEWDWRHHAEPYRKMIRSLLDGRSAAE